MSNDGVMMHLTTSETSEPNDEFLVHKLLITIVQTKLAKGRIAATQSIAIIWTHFRHLVTGAQCAMHSSGGMLYNRPAHVHSQSIVPYSMERSTPRVY